MSVDSRKAVVSHSTPKYWPVQNITNNLVTKIYPKIHGTVKELLMVVNLVPLLLEIAIK